MAVCYLSRIGMEYYRNMVIDQKDPFHDIARQLQSSNVVQPHSNTVASQSYVVLCYYISSGSSYLETYFLKKM